jgi:hypothetical protein
VVVVGCWAGLDLCFVSLIRDEDRVVAGLGLRTSGLVGVVIS